MTRHISRLSKSKILSYATLRCKLEKQDIHVSQFIENHFFELFPLRVDIFYYEVRIVFENRIDPHPINAKVLLPHSLESNVTNYVRLKVQFETKCSK